MNVFATHKTLFVLVMILSAVGLVSAGEAKPSRPNIVFILADDLGYGDLGCYGQKRILTPNLDRMAAEGMRFTQFYAGSTVCAPSRCCLMTGLHTGHATIRGNAEVPLRPQDITVAKVLKDAGYTTSLVGKWGLGEAGTTGVPNRQGFDTFYGYLNQVHAHNYYPDYLWKNQEKVTIEGNVVQGGVASKRAQYSPDLFTKEALAFVEQNREKPFFLYLAYTTPHANNERGAKEGNGMEVPSDAPYSDKSWPQVEKNYAAMVTRLDADVGRLLKRLKELGLDENTIVFFSSDNGPHKEGGADPKFFESAGPLRGLKRDLTEGGIREPTIVRWPGKVKAGVVTDQVGAFWDFLPTAAELAGAKAPAGLDGVSLTPTLLGTGKQAQHDFLYWEFHERGPQQAVRMGDWKALRLKAGGPLQLYDLKTDAGEAHDVAADHPNVTAKIEAYLKGARTESATWPIKPAKDGKN
jgi:arylsulfatase A-like enzyme